MEKNQHRSFKVLILGAGTGGIAMAARLQQELDPSDLAIVDSAHKHYYQPYWTMNGAGIGHKEETEKDTKSLIPEGVTWIEQKVQKIEPGKNQVILQNGEVIAYQYLVVATGLRLAWERIEGIQGQVGKDGICTIYEYDQVDRARDMIQNFKSGTAVFIMPPPPIKCAGAPQKIMYLAENIFRNNGVRDKIKIHFATPGPGMFGVPVFAEALGKIAKQKGIEPLFKHKITKVDASQKLVFFDVTDAEGKVSQKSVKYDLLHVVPPMSAHSFIAESGLAFEEGDQKGWLAVDRQTLQHLKYSNIFGIGDVTGVPNSKTGAAIRAQYPIVAKNLISVMHGQRPTEQYDGYASCPLITEFGKVLLAEFGYDNKLLPTFPLDPTVPRRSMWFLKKTLLPFLYWNGMMKGRF